MPILKEDLLLSLVVDPVTSDAKRALLDLQGILATIETTKASGPAGTGIQERMVYEREMASLKHRALMEELKVRGDPAVVRERLRVERELLQAREHVDRIESMGVEGGARGVGPTGGHAGVVSQISSVSIQSLKSLSITLSSLQTSLGPVDLGFKALDAALPGVGTTLGSVTSQLTTMAGLASPSTLKMFNIALEDVQGVIGQTFLPVLELMREGVRIFGDVLANILPNSNEVGSALKIFQEALSDFGDTMRSIMADWGPIIREGFIMALRGLAFAAAFTTKVIEGLVRALSNVLGPMRQWLAEVLGVTLGGGPRSAAGAAARAVHIEGFAEYQRRLIESAFREPGGPTQAEMPKYMKEMRDFLERVAGWTEGFTTEAIQEAIIVALGIFDSFRNVANRVGEVARGPNLPRGARLNVPSVTSRILEILSGQ